MALLDLAPPAHCHLPSSVLPECALCTLGGCWVPSLQGGSSAISTFPLHLVLYEGVTQISMVSSEEKYLIFHFCTYLTLFLFFLHFCTPLFLAMSDFLPNVAFSLFLSLTGLTSTDTSSLNMQPPALNVIRSKPTQPGEVLPLKNVLCAYKPLAARYALVGP